MLKGRSGMGVVVQRPGGPVSVTFGRTGVTPTGGCAVLFPVWLFRRIQWQLGDQTWTLTVSTSGKYKNLLTRKLDESTFTTKADGQAAAEKVLEYVREGGFDEQLRERV